LVRLGCPDIASRTEPRCIEIKPRGAGADLFLNDAEAVALAAASGDR
jgi:hypothetical protein